MLTGPADYDYHPPTEFRMSSFHNCPYQNDCFPKYRLYRPSDIASVLWGISFLAAGEYPLSRFRELRLEVVRSREAQVER
ncbi:hypothetical protein BELL_0211g00190 [Botrytis elliptica]|uniref:Uncharacterized protein n=1 Tax=Botrytis elliptica TaxID=278938 RepID=A0A4Z1JW57_9HELO|nr:hypothetical protein BELL_0211g00190 [Botrytis elliptica]